MFAFRKFAKVATLVSDLFGTAVFEAVATLSILHHMMLMKYMQMYLPHMVVHKRKIKKEKTS